MTHTNEQLEQLKEEYLTLTKKIQELSKEELELVIGGDLSDIKIIDPNESQISIYCSNITKDEAIAKGHCDLQQYCLDHTCEFNS